MTTQMSDIITALPDGALLIAASGRIVAANKHAAELLQTAPTGLAVGSVIRTPAFAEALISVANTRQPVEFEAEFRGRPPRLVSVQIAAVGADGDLLVLLRDLTREQAVEKMRSDFVANASHEMRTPLTSILGGIETLKGAAKDDPKARDTFLDMMLVQVQRMKRLIDDLLTLSRIELNEHVRPNAKVNLVETARLAKANLADVARAMAVTVELKAISSVEVAGDGDQLLQVVQNLVENAIKYGGAGGKVEIDCHTQGQDAILSVRDFGQGIAEHHLPRLTERFYRVSTQESRSRGGTGLGLAIVKHIALRHRGKLSIQSEVGRGSTFSISIPLM